MKEFNEEERRNSVEYLLKIFHIMDRNADEPYKGQDSIEELYEDGKLERIIENIEEAVAAGNKDVLSHINPTELFSHCKSSQEDKEYIEDMKEHPEKYDIEDELMQVAEEELINLTVEKAILNQRLVGDLTIEQLGSIEFIERYVTDPEIGEIFIDSYLGRLCDEDKNLASTIEDYENIIEDSSEREM